MNDKDHGDFMHDRLEKSICNKDFIREISIAELSDLAHGEFVKITARIKEIRIQTTGKPYPTAYVDIYDLTGTITTEFTPLMISKALPSMVEECLAIYQFLGTLERHDIDGCTLRKIVVEEVQFKSNSFAL